MSLPVLKNPLIKHAAAIAILSSGLHGAVYSTVLPYMQEAQMSINSQVTTGMAAATAKINAINESATIGIKQGYSNKEKNLSSIKRINAESTLLLKQIESAQTRCADLRAAGNTIEGSISQAHMNTTEKTSAATAAEHF